MKATTRVSLVLILVGLVVLLSVPALTGADGGANVVRGEDCTISLFEVGGGEVTTTDTQSVETPNGNLSLVCRAELPDGVDPPRRAARTSGELCGTPLGPTTDTDKIITPKGSVRLTCRINGRARPPATGWAAGNSAGDGYGVIIHTADGGQTWVRQGKPGEIPDVNLGGVAAIDAQNAWVVGAQGTILRTRNGGRTWQLQQVPAGVSEADLVAVSAVDGKTAWVAGAAWSSEAPGVILHTTDGGRTWARQGQGLALKAGLEGVYAGDADHAWLVGGVEPGERFGTIVRTSDAGATWERVSYTLDRPAASTYGLITAHGVDADTIWAVGHNQAIYSTDGGLTWADSKLTVGTFDENGVFAVDRDTVWVVTDNGGIYRSDNGGTHWERQTLPPGTTGDWVLRISAIDGQTAWAVTRPPRGSSPGHVLFTSDGGRTWVVQATPVDPSFWGVSFVR